PGFLNAGRCFSVLQEREKEWIRSIVDHCKARGVDLVDLKINPTRERSDPGMPAEIFRAIPLGLQHLGIAILEHGVLVLRDYSSPSPANLRKFTHLDQVFDML